MSKLMTVSEVAVIFRKSKDTIYRWISEGKVFRDIHKVGDGYLIPESEVKRVLEDNKR